MAIPPPNLLIGVDMNVPLNKPELQDKTCGSSITPGAAWTQIFNWLNGQYPVFAARYFQVGGAGNVAWQKNEGTDVKALTGNALKYILPLQTCFDHAQVPGGTRTLGVQDALVTCNNIAAALGTKELKLPDFHPVYVYLDIEQTDTHKNPYHLSPNYWAGWANTVYNYTIYDDTTLIASMPFRPAIYCNFSQAKGGSTYTLDSDVANPLTKAASNSHDHVECAAFWSSHPEPPRFCNPNPTFSVDEQDLNFFDPFTQPLPGGASTSVRVIVWQFIEDVACPKCTLAGGLNLDLDLATDDAPGDFGALNYMLLIN